MADDLVEKLLAESGEIAAERREKASESHMMAMMIRNSVNPEAADGWQTAAEYAQKTARVLDQTVDLARQVIALTAEAAALRSKNAALQDQNRKLVEAATRLLTWAEDEAEGYRACYEIPGTSEIQNASDAEFVAKIDGLLSEVRAAIAEAGKGEG